MDVAERLNGATQKGRCHVGQYARLMLKIHILPETKHCVALGVRIMADKVPANLYPVQSGPSRSPEANLYASEQPRNVRGVSLVLGGILGVLAGDPP